MSSYSMALVFALLLVAAPQGFAQTALSDWTSGVATNYGGPNDGDSPTTATFGLLDGACGYGDLSDASAYPFFSAVGIPTSSDIMSFPTMGCGTCIEFECVNDRTPDYAGRCGAAGSTVTAMVTDVCPQCSAATAGTGDHFDLNALSFAQLAPDLAGEIDINYRLVACTPPSDLSVQVDGNDGVGLWLRLVITTVANLGTISAVNIKGAASDTYTAMTNTYGAAWEVTNQPSYPISLEVTSGSQTVLLPDVLTDPTQGTFTSSQQFSSSSSTSTTITTTPTSSSSTTTSTTSSSASTSTSATTGTTPAATAAATTAATPVATPSASAAAAGTGCVDVTPQDSAFTCPQQAAFQQCNQSWMVGFCKLSCNTC